MIFLDTSVIVAASYDSHPDHAACLQRFAVALRGNGACALHTCSEVFAVLTRLPPPLRVSGDEASRIVERMSRGLYTVGLTPAEHIETVLTVAARGLRGGIVYDALLLACARKIAAEEIYTLNQKHFQMVAPDLASRILLP